jgi:hypothetical protein
MGSVWQGYERDHVMLLTHWLTKVSHPLYGYYASMGVVEGLTQMVVN